MAHYQTDYLIIGAGPAGLQLAYKLQQKGFDYAVLERADHAGAFFDKYPRHRTLISINKRFTGYTDPETNLRWDWNSLISDNPELKFTRYTKEYFPPADLMVRYLNDYAQHYQLNIHYNTEVTQVSKSGQFTVETRHGDTYEAKRLIVATGVSKPYIPDIPGIETTENYADVPVEKEQFEDKSVLVIGKGNSGFETADYLIDSAKLIHIASPRPIKMAWRSHYVGDLRAVNNNLLDTYQLKSQNAVVNAYITNIQYENGKYYVTFAYTLASKEVEVLEYDRVITCTGFQLDKSIFHKSCKPKLAIKKRFAALKENYESVNVPDLYFAGVLMQQRDFKTEQSAFVHGFRYNVDFLANYFAMRYHNGDLPHDDLPWSVEQLTDHIIKRVNYTSSLWQQTGYLCDAVKLDGTQKAVKYCPCVPHEYMLSQPIDGADHQLAVTLEFGLDRINRAKNVFAIERIHKHDTHKAHLSTGIHPVVYHYYKGRLQSKQHLIEDFMSEWQEPEHWNPLYEYLTQVFQQIESDNAGETQEGHQESSQNMA